MGPEVGSFHSQCYTKYISCIPKITSRSLQHPSYPSLPHLALSQNQNNTIARPPGPPPTIPPQQLPERKPRSHTVAADSYGSPAPDLPSSLEGSLEVSHSSLANSVETERQPSGEREMATEGRKVTPPPPPPQSSKPGKRVPPPPPKPRPLPVPSTYGSCCISGPKGPLASGVGRKSIHLFVCRAVSFLCFDS